MLSRIVCLGALLAVAGLAMAQQETPAPTTPVTPTVTRPSSLFSLGLGFGPMYGHAGANIEYHATGQLSATAGVGLDGDDQWFAGGRFYLRPEGKGSRPRITLGLGTDTDDGFYTNTDAYSSKFIFAVGGSWANAANDYRGFDIDLTSDGMISLGYHF